MNVEINGIKIGYTKTGTGEYVFLLHGWGNDKEVFLNLTDTLSSKYTVVAVDLPGFGDSEEPTAAWSIADYADFLIAFIKCFACDEIILIGHSFGGRMIIKLFSKTDLPFHISKIVLIDSAGIMPKRTLFFKFRIRVYKAGKWLLNIPFMRALFPRAQESLMRKMASEDYYKASPVMRGCFSKAVNEDLSVYLPKINVPTLLIWGELDTKTPVSDGRLMEELIPDSGLVVVKNAGHHPFQDQPFFFREVIKSFLKVD